MKGRLYLIPGNDMFSMDPPPDIVPDAAECRVCEGYGYTMPDDYVFAHCQSCDGTGKRLRIIKEQP